MKYDTKQVINEIIEQQTQEQEMFTENSRERWWVFKMVGL